MSTESLVEGPGGVLAGWETNGQVYFGGVSDSGVPNSIAAPGESGDRKHPALAVNSKGETLLAWTEGTGWQKGGSAAWQVFDGSGRPTNVKGRIPNGVPVWGLLAAAARKDDSFVIFH
jgi:hypothetical protein